MWVSLRRCCENLDVHLDTQIKKLRAKAWAVVREMRMTGPDRKEYQTICIDLDTLPGWLFSIDARIGRIPGRLDRDSIDARKAMPRARTLACVADKAMQGQSRKPHRARTPKAPARRGTTRP